MGYIARPPAAPKTPAQLSTTPSVKLHRGKGNETTTMVRDNATRHPVTKQWTARYQTALEAGSDVPVKVRKD
jgi:hypothetical protein